MKRLMITLVMLPLLAAANTPQQGDTVEIEINDRSKIVIYTQDRVELKNLEQYDLNKMIKDLNSALGSKKIEKIELQDENGTKYLKDTTIVLGEGSSAKTKVKIGNMELLVDAEDWEDVEDEWEDEDTPVKKYTYESRPKNRTENDFNVDIGLNNWMEGGQFPDANDQLYAIKPWGSWYVALNSVNKTWISGPLLLDWGMGLSWNNWRMNDPNVEIGKLDGNITFTDRSADLNGIKSRLQAPYLNVTIVPMLDFAQGTKKVKNIERGSIKFRSYKQQGLRFGVGGYAGYRVGSNVKFIYTEDGDRQKDKTSDNYYLANFRYGIRAQVGFKGLDLFATYDLNEVFAPNRGPAGSSRLNAIAFGITL